MMKKEKPVNLIASAVLFCVYVLTTVIDALTVRQISVSSSILCIGALIAYFVFLRRFEPLYYLGILVFTFFAQYLGACLHFYNIIPIYDLILHSASGVLLVLLAHYLLTAFFIKDIQIPLRLTLLCCFLFSVAAAGIWEIWEFSGDVLFGLSSQGGSLTDTMTDIIAGSCGAVVGTILLELILRRKKR